MSRRIWLAAATIFLATTPTHQSSAADPSTFYYAYNSRVTLTPLTDKIIVTPTPGKPRDVVEGLFSGVTFEVATRDNAYRVRGDASALAALRKRLQNDPSIHTIQPVYRHENGPEIGVADDFCVGFLPGVTPEQKEALRRKWNVSTKKAGRYFDVLRVGKGGDVLAIANAYQESGLVLYAHPNFIGAVELDYMPNDPYFGNQFTLHNTGQEINHIEHHRGTPDADVDAPEAWDITKGSSTVVIAVIDQGVTWTHPDLDANIWVNADEIPGNGLDDDNNGYTDDVRGWDFFATTTTRRLLSSIMATPPLGSQRQSKTTARESPGSHLDARSCH